jgi:hypothetical protein
VQAPGKEDDAAPVGAVTEKLIPRDFKKSTIFKRRNDFRCERFFGILFGY